MPENRSWGNLTPLVSLGIAFVSAVSVVSTMIEKTNATAERMDKIEVKIDGLAQGQCSGIKESIADMKATLEQALHDHDDVMRRLGIPTRKGEFPPFHVNGG